MAPLGDDFAVSLDRDAFARQIHLGDEGGYRAVRIERARLAVYRNLDHCDETVLSNRSSSVADAPGRRSNASRGSQRQYRSGAWTMIAVTRVFEQSALPLTRR